jgi:hypothetical protein
MQVVYSIPNTGNKSLSSLEIETLTFHNTSEEIGLNHGYVSLQKAYKETSLVHMLNLEVTDLLVQNLATDLMKRQELEFGIPTYYYGNADGSSVGLQMHHNSNQ